jgi:hypothetical protein
MDNEDFFRHKIVEFGERTDGAAAGIHEGQRFEQVQRLLRQRDFAVFALKFFVFGEPPAFAGNELIQ